MGRDPLFSRSLGVSGICDIVEFHRAENGVALAGHEGLWKPFPVEYKRGLPKESDADRLQLCCQAMCLEEMLVCEIPSASLYYGEVRHRTSVRLDAELRAKVSEMLCEMHAYFSRRYTPRVKPTKSCSACSLRDICLPKLQRSPSAAKYVQTYLREEDASVAIARHWIAAKLYNSRSVLERAIRDHNLRLDSEKLRGDLDAYPPFFWKA